MKTQRHEPPWAIAAVLGTVCCATHAQSIDYSAFAQLFGEPVTASATGSPQRASDVPANMEIVTGDDIRRSGADNIPDILRFVAGIDVRRYSFAQADVSVRGYDQQSSPRLLVLINGRQVHLDDYGYTAWQTLPVQLDEIRQIEVVKGPNSALFGFNAVGGVVNIITYDPIVDSTNVATLRGGTQSNLSGSLVATLPVGGNAGLRLSVGGSRADEFSTASLPATLVPYYTSPHAAAFSMDGRIKLTPKVELTVEGTVADARNINTTPVPSFTKGTYQTDSLKLGVAADTVFGIFNATAYRNQLHFPVASAGVNFGFDNVVYVVQANDLFKVGVDHTFRFGVEYRNDSISGAEAFRGTLGYNSYAASAMWNWRIMPKVTLTNSLRLDVLRLNYAGTLAPANKYTIADYDRQKLTMTSFNSGLVYAPTALDTLRLLVARGVQPPSLIDFGSQFAFNSGGIPISFIGSPQLDATSVMNYEIDYDRRLPAMQSTVRAAIYYQKTDKLLASALNAPLAFGPAGLVSYAQNAGSSAARGGEIGIKGAAASGVRWNVSYAYISITENSTLATLDGSSSLLAYVHGTPANVVNTGLGYSSHRFEFDLQGRWQSRFTDYGPTDAGSVAPFRINGYVTLHARVGYHVNEHVTIALAGEQLTHARVFEAAGTPVARRVIGMITGHF